MSFAYLFVPLALGVLYLLWKVITYFYEVATKYSGIHYVKHRRAEIEMNTRFFNPFSFEVDLLNASPSGVKCTMKSEEACYIKAMWCVSIYDLVEFLNKDWPDLINSFKGFDNRFGGVFNSPVSALFHGLEKVMEFKTYISLDAYLPGGVSETRSHYPFVLLMVLIQDKYQGKRSCPYVLASAHAIHLSDEALSRSVVITQFLRLSNGHVGQVKKVFRASADERSDLCLVCYQQPASIVQISCSHFCLCRSCYEKCDKCPICRNTRMDFFELPPLIN